MALNSRVAQQRKVQIVFGREFGLRLDAVALQPEHHGA